MRWGKASQGDSFLFDPSCMWIPVWWKSKLPLKSKIHQKTICCNLHVYAIINQNRVEMSEHSWTLRTSSLDLNMLETLPPTNDNQSKSGLLSSSLTTFRELQSATQRNEQSNILHMQKRTCNQHWVFSFTDRLSFGVFCYGSTVILKVIKRDFFLACSYWRRSANPRCWWLGWDFWLHFRHGKHGLNHMDLFMRKTYRILKMWEAWQKVHINVHCLLLQKNLEKINTLQLKVPQHTWCNLSEHTVIFEITPPHHPLPIWSTVHHCRHNIWGARHVGISRTPIL